MEIKNGGPMSYHRVMPRDLFNESKLLKCLGFITLMIHENRIKGLVVEHETEKTGFVIRQNQNDGSIYVENLHFMSSKGEPVYFYHPLNSKYNFPITMRFKNEDYYPFNENGDYQLSDDLFK